MAASKEARMGAKPKYSEEFITEATRHAKSCAKYATRFYFFMRPYAADVEAWCFLRYLEGRSLKTFHSRMVTDYMRKHFGDSRRKNHRRSTETPVSYLSKQEFLDSVEDSRPNPQESLEKTRFSEKMFESISLLLNPQETFVVKAYYFCDLKMHEIGKLLKVTESRISQIHDVALNKLRTKFDNPKNEC